MPTTKRRIYNAGVSGRRCRLCPRLLRRRPRRQQRRRVSDRCAAAHADSGPDVVSDRGADGHVNIGIDKVSECGADGRADSGADEASDDIADGRVCMASLADLLVNVAPGNVPSERFSTEGVAAFLKPSTLGLLVKREPACSRGAADCPVKPMEAIVGGTELISGGGKAFPVGGPLMEDDLIELGTGPVQRA